MARGVSNGFGLRILRVDLALGGLTRSNQDDNVLSGEPASGGLTMLDNSTRLLAMACGVRPQ